MGKGQGHMDRGCRACRVHHHTVGGCLCRQQKRTFSDGMPVSGRELMMMVDDNALLVWRVPAATEASDPGPLEPLSP